MPPIKLPTHVDRATLRMITLKRFVTGSLSLVFSLSLLVYGALKFGALNAESRLYWVLAVIVFAVGGTWSLRDALRGRRMLRGG